MVPDGREPIMFRCVSPKSSNALGSIGSDFMRINQASLFCHLRFSRPMLEGDNVECKVVFHDIPMTDGQCLISVTPSNMLDSKAKRIVKQNPFVVDPTTAWISRLRDNDVKRTMRFGIIYRNGSIQLRLPCETDFFPFYHVPESGGDVWIDVFFCEYVKRVGLRSPLFPNCPKIVRDIEWDDLCDEPGLIKSITQVQKATIVMD